MPCPHASYVKCQHASLWRHSAAERFGDILQQNASSQQVHHLILLSKLTLSLYFSCHNPYDAFTSCQNPGLWQDPGFCVNIMVLVSKPWSFHKSNVTVNQNCKPYPVVAAALDDLGKKAIMQEPRDKLR